jgi:V8-like Glu-specific endopeptidase
MYRTRGLHLSLGLAFLAAAITLAASAPAYALPVAQDNSESLRSEAPSSEELEAAGVDFTAIISMSGCSGSLVRFTTSKTSDRALVLTNGHCTGSFITAGTAVVNQASSKTFSLLSSTASKVLGTLRADELLYGTMTGTDIAIYRLTQTYAQITSRYGVGALIISDHHPDVAAPVRIVSGYWKKIYSCSIDKFIYELHESTWVWQDSIKFTQPGCNTIGGTSGSPIVHADTHEVIGINNTGNESGQRCTLDNPCEVDEHGNVTYAKGDAYGEQTYQIYTCLSSSRTIDLTLAGCKLTKPL